MKMAAVKCVLVLVLVSVALASDVPVLMWSPDRPLSDLPQAPSFDKIPQDIFNTNYLTQLLGKQSNVIIAFLQDKLHINDISKYADVYNQHSDGGAFKNIKGLLDEHFSLELPRVLGSHLALDNLRDNFPGTVHDLGSDFDLSGLDLGDKRNHLVIVRLLPIAGSENTEAAIASNDEVIGDVSRQLTKRSVRYTALYTAETSEERQKRESESHHTRQLMEAPQEATTNGVFFNMTYDGGNETMLAYLTSVSVCIMPSADDENKPTYCHTNFTVQAADLKNANMSVKSGANRTVDVVLTVDNIKSNYSSDLYNVSFLMHFKHQLDRWEIMEAQLTVTNSSGGAMVTDQEMITRGYDTTLSLLYSFHCTSMTWYQKNMTETTQGYIILGGFQIQLFYVESYGFNLSQDCVGWFTTGIWMALFATGIHVVILLFGLYMVSSLTTNDRFDDPKGKALIINSGE